MAIQQVAVVSVPVSDPARAKAFYVDVLGLELIHEDDSVPGLHWIQVAPRDGSTALTLVTWFESMPAGSLRGLVCGHRIWPRITKSSWPRAWSSTDLRAGRRIRRRRPSSATQTGTASFFSRHDRAPE